MTNNIDSNPNVPNLKHYEGSWVIVRLKTKDPICEIFRGSVLINLIDYNFYQAIPIGEYLANLNKIIKQRESEK